MRDKHPGIKRARALDRMNLTCNHIPEDCPGLSSVSSKAPSSQKLVLRVKGDDLQNKTKQKSLVLNHQNMLILTRACFPKLYIWQMFTQMPMSLHRCMEELLNTHKKGKQFLLPPITECKMVFLNLNSYRQATGQSNDCLMHMALTIVKAHSKLPSI